jgi:transcriptional regulator with XRE-family HTH domain
MNTIFCERIKELRKSKELSQERLAEAFGISIQAVSKWECAQSYPDIELLPVIAEFFSVTIDYLLRGESASEKPLVIQANEQIPNDGVLRIVQYCGAKLLRKDTYKPNEKIPLNINYAENACEAEKLQIEIWGSAKIDGDLYGQITAGNTVECGNITGTVTAGDTITCGNITGNASAGDGVNCGNINGNASAGDSINCGNVGGGVYAGDNVNCGDIGGNVDCEGEINCGDIKGDINSCEGDIHCKGIGGSVSCEGSILYKN